MFLCFSRMIPPTSKTFRVNNLASGTVYDLCVLAIYDDGITSLTATRVVGCIQFTTEQDYVRCHFMQSQFLGGTMIIIIGGIIVASVLVFIIILMIRYRVCNGSGQNKATKVSNVYSQTNGSQNQSCGASMPPSASKQVVGHDESLQCCKSSDSGAPSSDTCSSQGAAATTSASPHPWTPNASASLKQKRKTQLKPTDSQTETVLNMESQNTNRNNSTALRLSSRPTGSPTYKRAQSRPSKFLTLPADTSRAKRRYSLNGEIMEYHCYVNSRNTGGLWSKRSMSMNGILVQSDNSDMDSGKATFSSSEWILESTV